MDQRFKISLWENVCLGPSAPCDAVIKWFSRYVVLASKPGAPPEGSLSTSPGQRRKRSCSLCRCTRLILKLLFHKAAGLFHIGLHCHYQKFWMVPIEPLHAVASIQIRYQKVKLNQAKQTESPHHLRSGCFSRLSSKKSYFLVVINKHAEKKVSMEREQQR